MVDLGEEWVPYIFTERTNATEAALPQTYRATYLALSRGEYPNDHHGARAKRDRYLELYGIPPTLKLLRARFREAQKPTARRRSISSAFKLYQRIVPYIDNPKARRDCSQFLGVEQRIKALMTKQGVDAPSKLDSRSSAPATRTRSRLYEKLSPTALSCRAAQSRLACEGFFDGKAALHRRRARLVDQRSHRANSSASIASSAGGFSAETPSTRSKSLLSKGRGRR